MNAGPNFPHVDCTETCEAMGQHYIQQHYLRCFGIPGDSDYIWMYDKSSKGFKRLPVKSVAQSRGFYREEDERALSETVEQPAQVPLEELRNGRQVDGRARRAIATYIESMIKRVPHHRKKRIDMAPKVKKELLEGIRENPALVAQEINLTQTKVPDGIDQWEQRFDSRPLSMKDDLIRDQRSSSDVIDCIASMTWKVIKAHDANRFLTSDNPVFFDEGYGLKEPDGEFSFPLSSDVALHGSWKRHIVQKESGVVKEINRRTAFKAERFVFYHQKARWVSVVAEKLQPSLNRIW